MSESIKFLLFILPWLLVLGLSITLMEQKRKMNFQKERYKDLDRTHRKLINKYSHGRVCYNCDNRKRCSKYLEPRGCVQPYHIACPFWQHEDGGIKQQEE